MCRACVNDWKTFRLALGSLADLRRACSEARSPGLPRGLRPPPRATFAALPGGRAPAWMSDGPLVRPLGRWWEQSCVFELTEAQLRAELGRQSRRLKGGE